LEHAVGYARSRVGVLWLSVGLLVNGHGQLKPAQQQQQQQQSTAEAAAAAHAGTAGVAAAAAAAGDGADSIEDDAPIAPVAALLGSLMIVVGSLLHATFFVLADRLLRPPPASPAPRTRTSSAAAVRGCACKMHFPMGHFLDRLPRQARDKDRTGRLTRDGVRCRWSPRSRGWSSLPRSDASVSKSGLFAPFLYKNDRFAKTGSGQT
jgi:hypothetical protein